MMKTKSGSKLGTKKQTGLRSQGGSAKSKTLKRSSATKGAKKSSRNQKIR